MPVCPYRSLLADLDSQLSEHEIMTLGRTYSVREQPELDIGFLLAIAQDHLRKKQFEGFPDMLQAFTHEDRDRYNASCYTSLHFTSTTRRWSMALGQVAILLCT